MKKWKIRNKDDFYGEEIFYIASYNCSRSYTIGSKNSKRATSQMLAITNYLHNLSETSKKRNQKYRGANENTNNM